MRFLTKADCENLASRSGIGFSRSEFPHLPRGQRMPSLKHAADFIYDLPRNPLVRPWPLARIFCADLVEHLGSFTCALLWAYSYPFWWDRKREKNPPEVWRLFAHWRLAAGEVQPLRETPGHLFQPNETTDLTEAIAFVIDMQCDAVVFTRPLRDVILLDDACLMTVRSKHNVSRLAEKLTRRGLRLLPR
jgi:hypothetical protein